jgi:hypothetical protein
MIEGFDKPCAIHGVGDYLRRRQVAQVCEWNAVRIRDIDNNLAPPTWEGPSYVAVRPKGDGQQNDVRGERVRERLRDNTWPK